MVKIIYKFPFLLFLFLSGILIFCWFRFGFMYGGGDTGLPTYNPQAAVNISKNIWWDSLAPGIPVAQGLTSTPMLLLLAIPQSLGASPVFIQALLFFTLLFLMGYGMYLLALSIFGKSNRLLAITAGVFYLFNPYMMIQVWHRFIHNPMFFVAFLPFLIMTWRAWIKKRNPMYLLLFLLVNFLAVYIYGTIAFIVPVWTLLILLTLFEAVVPWKGRKAALSLFFAFLIGLILWLLTNSWWLIPTFSVSPAIFAQVHTTDDSLSTLMSLSASTILPYTLRLINPFYLYWLADWGSIYQNPIFLIISWLFVLIVFIGFIRGLKQKQYIIWSLLFLVVIFLSKGAAPPFNFPYIWGFSHFFPLGVIRNPFEKLGILLPLVYAILFAFGLQYLIATSIKYIGKSKTYFILVIFILLHMAFFWPMFAGKLFGTLEKQNFVEVPQSYVQANNWIKQDLENTTSNQDGRILHLPLSRSESVTYNWQHGYNGVEPSAAIFTSLPSIARGLDIPGVNDALSGLSLIFHKPNTVNNQAVILKMLQDFNVKYIILHKDVDWLRGELYNPLETETVLDRLEFLDKKITFGGLTVYKLKGLYFSPKIVISDNVVLLYPSKNNLFWPWIVSTSSSNLITSISEEKDSNIMDKVRKIIFFPESSQVIRNAEIPEFKGDLDKFNNIKILPTSFLYSLIEAKEQLSLIGKNRSEKQQSEIIFAEKRLVEMYKIKRMRELGIIEQTAGSQLIISAIRKYNILINDIFNDELKSSSIFINNQEFSILDVFLRHVSLLQELTKNPKNGSEKGMAESTILLIKKNLVKNGLLPKYPQMDEKDLVKDYRQLYTFNIPFKLTYDLLMNNPIVKNIYPDDLSEFNFQINGIFQKSKEEDKGNFMLFGRNELEIGEYQISIPRISSTNLIPAYLAWNKSGDVTISQSTDTIEISSGEQSPSFIEGEINSMYGESSYLFGFDLKVLSGRGIRIQMIQDTDKFDKKMNKPLLRYNSYYTPTYLDSSGWSHFDAIINSQLTTQKAKLKIVAEPWDDCLVVLGDKKRCLEERVKLQYNQPSKFIIKNINVSRLLNNAIVLSADLPVNQPATSSGVVFEINKQSPDLYTGKVRITKPTLMFFKETFSYDWELSLTEGKEIYKPNKRLIGNLYSNAWVIEKTGDYDFVLSYNPQKSINISILLSSLGWAVLVLLVIVRYNFRRLFLIK